MVIADAWSTVGGIASAVAAGAAVIALLYARSTVKIARDTLAATKTANAEAHQQHLDEIRERREALEAEAREVRLRQLERVNEFVTEIGEAVYDVNRGVPTAPQTVQFRQHELKVSLAALRALGGPDLPRCNELTMAPTDRSEYVTVAAEEVVQALSNIAGR